jgi:hypothetical protein
VLLAEPWRPRRGVNAIRLNIPFSERIDASSVLGLDDALEDLRAAARLRVNVAGTDVAVVGAWRGEALAGIDMRGTLGVGWWLEAAWLFGDEPHEEVSAGIDYSLPVLERLLVYAQYYRNGAGSERVSLAALPLRREPFAPFVRGRDYALAGASVAVLTELNASLATLHNLNDGSGLGFGTVSVAALDWLEVAAAAQVPYGNRGELRPRKRDLRAVPVGSGTVDLSGSVAKATLTVWTRASF